MAPTVATSDLIFRLSGGASNADPKLSVGGAMSTVLVVDDVMNNIWDNVDGIQLVNGSTEVRCIYIYNANTAATFASVKAWISQPSIASSNTISIGAGNAAAGTAEPAVANETIVPGNVIFVTASTQASGISLGNIGPQQYKAIWIKRVTAPGSEAFPDNGYTIRVQGKNSL
jgi:hypothetical protein